MDLHFLRFWPCGPSFPCILDFWAFISLHFGVSFWAPPHKLPKAVRFPKVPYKEFSSARPGSILQFLAFWAFISFHFGLVGLHFLSFLALWTFISFDFGLVGLHFLAFRPCGGSASGALGGQLLGPPRKLPKTVRFPKVP